MAGTLAVVVLVYLVGVSAEVLLFLLAGPVVAGLAALCWFWRGAPERAVAGGPVPETMGLR